MLLTVPFVRAKLPYGRLADPDPQNPTCTVLGHMAKPLSVCTCGRLAALPSSVQHLVVLLTVPIVFAKLPLSEGTLAAIDSLPSVRNALAKTGLGTALVDKCATCWLYHPVVCMLWLLPEINTHTFL